MAEERPRFDSGPGEAEGLHCLAIVLCDAVIEDKASSKKTLVGLFNTLGAANYPVTHPAMSVLVTLSGGRGETRLEMRIGRAGGGPEIVRVGGPVVFPAPGALVDLVVHLQNLVIPAPGVYAVEIRKGGTLLAARRFRAVLVAPPPPPPAPPAPGAPGLRGAPPGAPPSPASAPPGSWRVGPSEN